MELMKMYSVMDQVANAGALTVREKKYLKQGLKIKSSALNRVSMPKKKNLLYFLKQNMIRYLTYHFTTFHHFRRPINILSEKVPGQLAKSGRRPFCSIV